MRSPCVILALAYAVFSVLYLGAAAFPLAPPITLSPSALDDSVPRLPWTIWIYLSQFPFLAFVYWRAWGSVAWARNLRGMLAVTVASACVFVLWPTRIVREAVDADPATTLAFAVLYGTDPASNCVPSLHVSLALLGATGFWPERPRLAGACLGWAALIIVSTLTTKQHYALDILAGVVVAAGAARLARRIEPAAGPHREFEGRHGYIGGPSRPPDTQRDVEERHGLAGALPSAGGSGGPNRPRVHHSCQ